MIDRIHFVVAAAMLSPNDIFRKIKEMIEKKSSIWIKEQNDTLLQFKIYSTYFDNAAG